MKKFVYIVSFVVFGLLLATVVHGLVEIPLLQTFTGDPSSQNIFQKNWNTLHPIGGFILWILGAIFGVWGGFRYWRILYVEKRYGGKGFFGHLWQKYKEKKIS